MTYFQILSLFLTWEGGRGGGGGQKCYLLGSGSTLLRLHIQDLVQNSLVEIGKWNAQYIFEKENGQTVY